jgi:gas vesicle protein
MNKVIARLKSIRLDRILTAFLVGLMLLANTACSGGASAKTVDSAKTADQIRQEVPSGAVTNQYKGGMNDYSDVDPRKATTEADAKAKGLVDNARRNINQKSIDSPEQYVENYRSGTPLGERTRRIGEDVGKAADNVTGEAAKGTRENVENIKAVSKDAAKSTKRTVDKTSDTVESKVKSDVRSTQRAVDKAADNTENLGDKIKQAAQDAADAVKSNINQVAD